MALLPTIAKRELAACSLICVLALAQPIGALQAQTALGTASVYQDSLPRQQTPPTAPEIIGSVQDITAAIEQRSEIARPSLRHLPMSAAGWRMAGEAATLSWQVYMTADEAAQPQRFRLSYAPSVSVLPDISTIALAINEVGVGRIGVASPNDLKPVEFAIAPNVLRPGFNEVRISVDQRHRVDCSTDATYELWTGIEPDNTGFLAVRNRLPIGIAELAALAPRADGRLVIRVAYAGKMKPRRIEQTIVASQAVALAARTEAPLVSFTADPDAAFGINLMVGTADELADLLKAFPDRTNISGPTLSVAYSGPDAAPTLIVAGRSDGELADAIDQFVATAMSAPPAQMHSVRDASHLTIAGGETIRLQDLGLASLEFSGRVFRLPIEVDMPSDFLVADYGKLSVNLSGAYAAGLMPGAQVQVNLNGKDSASVPLSNASGGLFHHNDIFIPLTALRPGRNVLEVAASLPGAGDKSCDTTIPITDAAKRFLLLGDSEIRFPPIARVGQMPQLAQTSAGGYPFSIPDSKPTLYIPKPDRNAMSAALTLAVRLAVTAGHPIPFDLVLANPGRQAGNGLVVAPARSSDPGLMAEIGLDPEAVQRGWKNRATTPDDIAGEAPGTSPGAALRDQRSDRRLVTGSLQASGAALLAVSAYQMQWRNAPSDAWASLLARRSMFDQAWNWIGSGWHAIAAEARSATAAVRAQLTGTAQSSLEIGPTASLIVAQGYRKGDIPGVITMVTAPDSATLARSVETLVAPARWSELTGRIAVLDEAGRILESTKAGNVQFSATQPPSLGNLRLIMAGWLSLNPAFYVIAALLLAGLLALTSRSLVKHVGRSNP